MADVRRTGSRPGAGKETAQPSQSVTSYAVSEFGVRVVVAARICASCRCSNAVRPSPRASLRRGYPGAIDVLADQRKGVGIGVIVGLKRWMRATVSSPGWTRRSADWLQDVSASVEPGEEASYISIDVVRTGWATAMRVASSTRRVLPMPASLEMSNKPRDPARADSTRHVSSPNSAWRPMKRFITRSADEPDHHEIGHRRDNFSRRCLPCQPLQI